MDSALTAAHQTILDRAVMLSKESLAPRAAAYDRDAAYPKESWQDLWEAGLFGMLIPQEYGGLGLDTPAYISVLETLAKGLRVQRHDAAHALRGPLPTSPRSAHRSSSNVTLMVCCEKASSSAVGPVSPR